MYVKIAATVAVTKTVTKIGRGGVDQKKMGRGKWAVVPRRSSEPAAT